jgi:hypothetical protein
LNKIGAESLRSKNPVGFCVSRPVSGKLDYLPVVQAEKFDFIIDPDTAKALRFEIPPDTTPPRRPGVIK